MRVMSWNIQKMYASKWQGSTPYPRAAKRFFLDTITMVDPDVIVIQEVMTTDGERGTLIDGSGKTALLKIAKWLRKRHPDWCMVPALRLAGKRPHGHVGKTPAREAAGTFYRRDRIEFTGPGPAMEVPPPWSTYAGNNLSGGVTYQADYVETSYDRDGGEKRRRVTQELLFPGELYRNPWQVDFKAGSQRVRIWSVHTSPYRRKPRQTLQQMGAVDTIKNPPEGVIDVVCGDFNIDVFEQDSAFRRLTQLDFDVVIPQGANPERADWGTMYAQRKKGSPLPAGQKGSYRKNRSIDNFLVRGAASAKAYVVDRVPTPPATNGLPNITSALPRPLSCYTQLYSAFRGPNGFGAVRFCSDHLPIVLELN